MNYFESIPTEICEEILFLVEPKMLFNACTINQHTLSICDDIFYYKYIQRNFDPDSYGLKEFVLSPHVSNWKRFLNILVNGLTVPSKIIMSNNRSNLSKIRVNIHFEDTLKNIFDNCKNIASNEYPNMRLVNLKLIGPSKLGKTSLIIYDNSAKLRIDNAPTYGSNKIYSSFSAFQLCNSDDLVTKIGGDDTFYLNLEKIYVYVGKKPSCYQV
jgi:hypothetical protein